MLEPAGPGPVNRDLAPGMADAQLVAGDHHAHAFTDHPPSHRIGIAVNPDHTVSLHLAHQLARHRKRQNASDRAQTSGFRTSEALDRHLIGRAVHPLIGDIAGLPVKVGLQCRPALEAPAGNRVGEIVRPLLLSAPTGEISDHIGARSPTAFW